MESFSKRQGYSTEYPEITVREDAPDALRHFVIDYAYENKLRAGQVRSIVCSTLKVPPALNNWSDENVQREVDFLLCDCPWYKVYDIVEEFYKELTQLNSRYGNYNPENYAQLFNELCLEKGIGWQLVDGKVIARGGEVIDEVVELAKTHLLASQKLTASHELHQAYLDISKRPAPDITGTIQHAIAALECVARDISGSKDTLGQIIKTHKHLFSSPINEIATKIYGYASNNGRHVQEGKEISLADAWLVLGLSASLISFLQPNIKNYQANEWNVNDSFY